MKKPQNIYDNQNFFKEYHDMRETKLNANELIEIPTIKTMLPDLKGKRILELGCGNGTMSKYFIDNGADYVLATDISVNMINEAKEKHGSNKIDYKVMGMETINELKDKYDIVFSSLAFHYIEDFNKLIKDICSLLKDDGYLVFSQEHPNVTAPVLEPGQKNRIEINNKRYYLVSDYSFSGIRTVIWNDTNVIKYHRTFSYIIMTLLNNKLVIEDVKESFASQDVIEKAEKYKHQNHRPFFLFIKAKKSC